MLSTTQGNSSNKRLATWQTHPFKVKFDNDAKITTAKVKLPQAAICVKCKSFGDLTTDYYNWNLDTKKYGLFRVLIKKVDNCVSKQPFLVDNCVRKR